MVWWVEKTISVWVSSVRRAFCRSDWARRISRSRWTAAASLACLHPRRRRCRLADILDLHRRAGNEVNRGAAAASSPEVVPLRWSCRGTGRDHSLPCCTVTCQRCGGSRGAAPTAVRTEACPGRLRPGEPPPRPALRSTKHNNCRYYYCGPKLCAWISGRRLIIIRPLGVYRFNFVAVFILRSSSMLFSRFEIQEWGTFSRFYTDIEFWIQNWILNLQNCVISVSIII